MTEQNPGAVGALDGEPGATLSTVLWRRHERPSDQIYLSENTNVTFRSALDALRISDVFPTIPDPDTSRDNPGDLNLSSDAQSRQELQDAQTSCENAWVNLLRDHDTCSSGSCTLTGGSCSTDNDCPGFATGSLPGIPVINAQRLTGCGCAGLGSPTGRIGNAVDDHATWSPNDGYVYLQDRSESPSATFDTNLVAHELGHVLGLWHTHPANNVMTSAASGLEFSTSVQDMVDWSNPPDPFTGTVPRTIDQIAWIPVEAAEWPGSPNDPPGILIPGPVQSFIRPDAHGDAPATELFVDLSGLRVTQNSLLNTTQITHRVRSVVDNATTSPGLNYWTLLDADNDPSTGGTPASYPADVPSTAFSGVELITQVRIVPSTLAVERTVWQHISGAFVPSASEFIVAFISRNINEHAPRSVESLFEYVNINMPASVSGPLADTFRIQACTHNEETDTVDCLDDGDAGAGFRYSLTPPTFPVCAVTPAIAGPTDTVTVNVSGMDAEVGLHVVLGDQHVADGMTDINGDAAVPFRVDPTSRAGLRLVTVGIDDTALTADCFVEVSAALPIALFPAISLNAPGNDHTVTALVRNDSGDPVAGVAVDFDVTAGPNAGTTGTCTTNSNCTTDAQGLVSFTYSSDGESGVDEISASYTEDLGDTFTSNTVLKFWDVDCNQNDIADTCDIDCGGFGGSCSEVLACGTSSDSNGDGVPDECNTPPDCSNAGAEPDELWPPNHKFRNIAIAGVTDEDGDPITTTIMSIRQDEPVEGKGDGKTSPDGVGVGGSVAQVRAERSGKLQDGRVYHIGFTASDDLGATCSGEVQVCVPHDQRPHHFCVDQGPLYDSTEQVAKPGANRKKK